MQAENALTAFGESPITFGSAENVLFNRLFVEGVIARITKDEDRARENHPGSAKLRAGAVRAWFDRRRSRPERGSITRRPARGRASSNRKRSGRWQRDDQIFGDDRCMGWRQRSRLRTACQRHPTAE